MAQKYPENEEKIHRYQAETEEKRRELAGLKEEADRLRDEAQKMKELREAKVEQSSKYFTSLEEYDKWEAEQDAENEKNRSTKRCRT